MTINPKVRYTLSRLVVGILLTLTLLSDSALVDAIDSLQQPRCKILNTVYSSPPDPIRWFQEKVEFTVGGGLPPSSLGGGFHYQSYRYSLESDLLEKLPELPSRLAAKTFTQLAVARVEGAERYLYVSQDAHKVIFPRQHDGEQVTFWIKDLQTNFEHDLDIEYRNGSPLDIYWSSDESRVIVQAEDGIRGVFLITFRETGIEVQDLLKLEPWKDLVRDTYQYSKVVGVSPSMRYILVMPLTYNNVLWIYDAFTEQIIQADFVVLTDQVGWASEDAFIALTYSEVLKYTIPTGQKDVVAALNTLEPAGLGSGTVMSPNGRYLMSIVSGDRAGLVFCTLW